MPATLNGTAALTANARLGATGAFIENGTAHLAAVPKLGVSGTATALAAAPRLTATARLVRPGQAALTANAVLGAYGVIPTLSAAPTLTAAARVTEVASAHLAASPSIAATPSTVTVTLHAAATLLVPGGMGAAFLTAGPMLTATAQTAKTAQVFLEAEPILYSPPYAPIEDESSTPLEQEDNADWIDDEAGEGVFGLVTEVASAHLAAAPSLAAAAKVTEPASVHLAAPATLTAATSQSAASLTAPGILTANVSAFRAATATLLAYPVLYSAGHYPLQDQAGNPIEDQGGGWVAGPGGEGASAFVTEQAVAAFHAVPVLHATAFRTQHASAALSAPGKLTVAATRTPSAAAHLSAPGSLHAAATRSAVGAAHLAANPHLTVAGIDSAAAHLNAAPVLHATAGVARAAKAALKANAVLTASPRGTAKPVVAFAAAPTLVAVPTEKIVAQALLAAHARLTVHGQAREHPPHIIPAPRVQPTWQRDVQHWAIAQERQRHAQALWQYGELVMFCLLWRPQDIDAGTAQRCTRCYTPTTAIAVNPPQLDSGAVAEAQISAAYGQGNQYRCALCYGTQIIAAGTATVPGVRALLVRPAVLTDTDQNQQRTAKGVVNPGTVNIQTTPDFRAHTYDYMFRTDARRYQLAVPARTTLRTGFATPWQQSAAIDCNLMRASLEDPQASVAYTIPPAADLLAQALGTYTRIPVSYAWIEQINGPLIPGETPPPAAAGDYQPPVTLPGGLPALQQT